MTFYWWSHWFWITTLSAILLSITIVQTYPSQEISLKYNQNSKSVKDTVTKLHQTTASTEWSTTTTAATTTTTTPRQSTEENAIVEPLPQQSQKDDAKGSDEDLSSEKVDSSAVVQIDSETEQKTAAEQENVVENENTPSTKQFEYKRSAESFNKTLDDVKDDDMAVEEPKVAAVVVEQRSAAVEEGTLKLKRDDTEMSNYTNFSRTSVEAGSNATCMSCNTTTHESNSTTAATHTLQAPKPGSIPTSSSTASPVTPKSRLDTMHSETLEWLNAMAAAAALPAPKLLTNAPQSDEIDREMVGATTESATAEQRVPFTLENVNKEEELRRAENEHRSRKSKVLSAEYKHINRFINFSADSKSLLTRSASTAPNDFGGVEEGNISSEALSIQRTYFLDAGAISAICFTIFGVCCTVGTIGIVLYRRRYLNKPQALSEPDSSVYIDDSTMRLISFDDLQDNSDEMYSLDNDSFLNSLEAMTIQNYWTDTVKHTKL
ncbi:mucin-5AC isoform X1 [Anastrepha obliqua]|uniref:mucin-5AC isoform X1 n=1 Tax=Anastrepha obliqua TaxID=95512 RepID=UPI002409889D|nr:mucin-5AC isoform X1 [Anastrepha obliqua]XP_054729774.1 mucin-5AC isoform X1 [Anastrepha obliqua]XP_054729775.1 mucin-5AC isoform X1 [Anastrepha obliqua]XP_054729776.1 mucin-5AC isoform X1 [Anastrepha obliqua]